jgi:hypothetical protein
MRTTLKIMPPLVVSAATVSLLFAACQVRTEKRNVHHHLSRCAETLDESLQKNVEPLLERSHAKHSDGIVFAAFGSVKAPDRCRSQHS